MSVDRSTHKPDEQARRAIVIVFDRLGAGYLGPYGNTWLETPIFNQLASDSMVLEHAIADAVNLDTLYGRLWGGLGEASLLETCEQRQVSTRLVTDEDQVARHALASAFQQTDLLRGISPGANREPDETAIGQLMAAALGAIDESQHGLTWIHGRAMQAPWDAPWELRAQFADEEDPPPPDGCDPPVGTVPADPDPDLIQGWVWAYAGQVALLDACLEPVLETWNAFSDTPTLLIVTAARGYSLGEHGHWGDASDVLYSERVHVPLFVACTGCDVAQVRSQTLVQTSSIQQTLRDWFGFDDEGAEAAGGSLLSLCHQDVMADGCRWPPLVSCRDQQTWLLRTPVWSATLANANAALEQIDCRLYLKPDDIWDANDVAGLCPEVVLEFRKLLWQLSQANASYNPHPLHECLLIRPE